MGILTRGRADAADGEGMTASVSMVSKGSIADANTKEKLQYRKSHPVPVGGSRDHC